MAFLFYSILSIFASAYLIRRMHRRGSNTEGRVCDRTLKNYAQGGPWTRKTVRVTITAFWYEQYGERSP